MTDSSRRSFLKSFALGVAALPVLTTIGSGPAVAQVPTTALDVNDSMAKAMGYFLDHTKVDKVAFPKKAGPDSEKQMCKNCVLYLEGGKKVDGQTGEFGRCGLFQNGLVTANGWCNSFALKA